MKCLVHVCLEHHCHGQCMGCNVSEAGAQAMRHFLAEVTALLPPPHSSNIIPQTTASYNKVANRPEFGALHFDHRCLGSTKKHSGCATSRFLHSKHYCWVKSKCISAACLDMLQPCLPKSNRDTSSSEIHAFLAATLWGCAAFPNSGSETARTTNS
eukprot:1621646-Amphidinium_carterae.1